MKNFIQRGAILALIAPYAVASGGGMQVGAIFAVASKAAAQGEEVEGAREGVFTLPKTAGQAWTQGARIYWDDANRRCDTDSTKGQLIGAAAAAVAGGATEGNVLLSEGIPAAPAAP